MPGDLENGGTQELLRDMVARVRWTQEAVRAISRALVEVGSSASAAGGEAVSASPLPHHLLHPALRSEVWRQLLEIAEGFPRNQRGPEVGTGGWQYLVARAHPWRRQLYLKGRDMTVRQLVGTVKANKLTPEEAAEDLELPVEAVREALRYAEENEELLELEAAYERYLLVQGGYKRGAPSVPR
jgi:uncharacterized protein (DUF433 family)